ncbi:MAG: ATP-dependent helicase [Deltaproteobacteria bacterium]|jgi:DNA helicase-2/ATP-dependent DNA helicase PcrA|nr:MAG: ATP-dependent helicase [Deltaproteobacteria bacterium]
MNEYRLNTLESEAKKPFKIKYEDELNESQLKAVEVVEGPILVIAGAGSGKTRTLVYRVARLVEEGVNPEHILLLTFTRKASHEMLRRASAILDERCGKVSGGTFHSFANTILRRYANLIGFNNNFTILDRGDSEDVINLIRAQFGFHKKELRFPRKQAVTNVISKSINKGCSIEDVLTEDYPQFAENSNDLQKIHEEYKRYKKAKSIMDYDDLLIYLKILLQDNDDIRAKLSNFYRFIMIDEYQDTNRLQANIVRLLASEHQNIMAVGDDSQSIYSFRGANFRNIMDFPKIFPGTKIITIEQNYRSTQSVLDLTNEIIERAKEKYSKTLFTRKEGRRKPAFIETQNENYQSKFIIQRISELREEGVPLNNIAVLFRAAWHSNDLEIELASHSIPYVKYGGFKFIETAHAKDVIAHLRIVFNPLDSISWHRALLLIEGIGPKIANDITSEIVDNKRGLHFLRENRFMEKKYHKDLSRLSSTIEWISDNETVPAEQIRILLEYYKPLLENKYDDFNKRLNDLYSLVKICERYNNLEQFLVDVTLEPLEMSQTDAGITDKENLTLSTIHSAKGLEWHTVFIIFLVDGYLPSSYSLDDEESIEEERRLFYVATTRAKENLYLIKPEIEYSPRNYFSQSYSGFSRVSRFLSEGDILKKYVERWALES